MSSLIDTLLARVERAWSAPRAPTTRRAFHCTCGQPLFFPNHQCLACQATLGYEPRLGRLQALEPAGTEGLWRLSGVPAGLAAETYRLCAHREGAAGCNWLVPARDGSALCLSCQLTRTTPDPGVPGQAQHVLQLEAAKRRLVSSLVGLGLPVASRLGADPARGLAFDFLANVPGEAPVLTGHRDGIITINVAEADDAWREQTRAYFNEPYRTLLGHFRHEVGHYYWGRLVAGTPWQGSFRIRFGDERQDYKEALERHHREGPPADWSQRYVSAYASAHPWEDWAETWAHYLHIVDTLDTALSFGLDAEDVAVDFTPFDDLALDAPGDPQAARFLAFINAWTEIAAVLNELSRSMGQPDFYPFVLSRSAVAKLHFVHRVVHDARQGD